MSIQTLNKMKDNIKCPECEGNVRHTLHESYCTKCGLVVDDSPVDDNDVTLDSNGNIKNKRTGPPLKSWERISTII